MLWSDPNVDPCIASSPVKWVAPSADECHGGTACRHARPAGVTERLTMNRHPLRNCLARLLRDEQGGEVIEYALIAGLIAVAVISVVAAFGGKVMARWNSVNSGLQ